MLAESWSQNLISFIVLNPVTKRILNLKILKLLLYLFMDANKKNVEILDWEYYVRVECLLIWDSHWNLERPEKSQIILPQ